MGPNQYLILWESAFEVGELNVNRYRLLNDSEWGKRN
jgi:hypothetical protein